MQIKYSDIPQWLQNSEFYRNLGSDEVDEFIEIPEDCFRESSEQIRTADDLADILSVMRFWLVAEIPQSVFAFCYANDWSVWNPVFVDIIGEGTSELVAVNLACQHSDQFSLSAALTSLRPEMVSFWMSINHTCTKDKKYSIAQACRFGRLDLVKTLRERQFPFHVYAFCAAAQYGHLDTLRYLHEQNCPYDERAQLFAARGGHLDCMTYLRSIHWAFSLEVTLEYAVPAHYLHLSKKPPSAEMVWTDDFSLIPPPSGYIDCLRFALSNNCHVHKFATHRAARYGLLDCLQLLHQYEAHWDAETFAAAAEGGHLDCLTYMHDHGCPTSSEAIYKAAENGHLHCLQYLHDILTYRDFMAALNAATNGHLHCLQWLHENGYSWNGVATARAAKGGYLDCLKYLHIHGCAWTKDCCENAAEGGHLECLKYLHENGCPWDEWASASAAHFNRLTCLQYLHDNGCLWDRFTATDAAMNGHLECLRYALEHGCPGNLQLLVQATAGEKGTLSCLKYLIEERGTDALLNTEVFGAAFARGNVANVRYLLERGFDCKTYVYVCPPYQHTLSFTDADFLSCMELAVEYGWQPNEELHVFVLDRTGKAGIVQKPAHALPLCLAFLDKLRM